jgi:hypothetical protein
MKYLYPGDYRTANSIDPPTSPMGIAAPDPDSEFYLDSLREILADGIHLV